MHRRPAARSSQREIIRGGYITGGSMCVSMHFFVCDDGDDCKER